MLVRIRRRRIKRAPLLVLSLVSFLTYSSISWLTAFVGCLSAPPLLHRAPPRGNGAVVLPLEATAADTGITGTDSFRRFFLDDSGNNISPWHDVDLQTGIPGQYWMVSEIPKMTRAKFEIATREPLNPLRQDVKEGELRDYHGPIFWNYGYMPQTWEDPNSAHGSVAMDDLQLRGLRGDNDPLDVVEIGSRAIGSGEMVRVKVLGALALVDEGEIDWKILTIASDDPLALNIDCPADVEEQMPGVVSGIREWFRWYKTPDGKVPNMFGFAGEALDAVAAVAIVEEMHDAWKRLRNGSVDKSDLWTDVTD